MITLLSRIINTIAPSRCIICGGRLSAGERFICASCNLHFPRTGFELTPYDNEMARMFWGRFPIEKAASLFFYHSHTASADIILSLKYYDRPDFGYELGRLIGAQFSKAGFFDDIDAIMPMPLASNRERKRGYNQSHEISRGICEITRLPLITDAISRSKFVETQTRKTRDERNANVEKAFKLVKPEKLENRHILLVDDVATTGATATACAKEILKACNAKVSIVTAGFVMH